MKTGMLGALLSRRARLDVDSIIISDPRKSKKWIVQAVKKIDTLSVVNNSS